jgi:hypothetical protein
MELEQHPKQEQTIIINRLFVKKNKKNQWYINDWQDKLFLQVRPTYIPHWK